MTMMNLNDSQNSDPNTTKTAQPHNALERIHTNINMTFSNLLAPTHTNSNLFGDIDGPLVDDSSTIFTEYSV